MPLLAMHQARPHDTPSQAWGVDARPQLAPEPSCATRMRLSALASCVPLESSPRYSCHQHRVPLCSMHRTWDGRGCDSEGHRNNTKSKWRSRSLEQRAQEQLLLHLDQKPRFRPAAAKSLPARPAVCRGVCVLSAVHEGECGSRRSQ
eukprot:scaffold40438_cov37-Tisochrysis_lutea.AAC.1